MPTQKNSPLLNHQVEVIAAIRNAGKGQVNVTHVMGSLNDAENFAAHYQNFSLATPQTEIAPGAEAAVVYHFRPDPILPERDFQVALTAFYTLADGTRGAATFFNKTIAIVEPQRAVDWQLLQLLLTMGALVAAAGYAAYAWALGAGVIKKAKKARVAPAAAPTAADSAEWLKGTFYGGKAKKAA
jgi:Translocon-associated protein (TRAP), alpha subunit